MRSLSVTTIRRTSSATAGAGQDLVHPLDVVGSDPDAAWPAQDVAELLAGAADGGRVDDGQELVEVVGQHAVEERLVAVLQRCQPDVLLEVIRLAAQVLELEGRLLVDRHHPRRQQPAQAEPFALVLGEGGALVEQGLGNKVAGPALGDDGISRRQQRAAGRGCPGGRPAACFSRNAGRAAGGAALLTVIAIRP